MNKIKITFGERRLESDRERKLPFFDRRETADRNDHTNIINV